MFLPCTGGHVDPSYQRWRRDQRRWRRLKRIDGGRDIWEEGDERWQRRQFSKIWTVMPSAQDFVPPKTFGVESTATSIAETDAERSVAFGLQDQEHAAIPAHRVESL
eukprot:symbB.v1.2.039903.t1/scaffold6859.1/size15008/1